jgi:hypothetical protein
MHAEDVEKLVEVQTQAKSKQSATIRSLRKSACSMYCRVVCVHVRLAQAGSPVEKKAIANMMSPAASSLRKAKTTGLTEWPSVCGCKLCFK